MRTELVETPRPKAPEPKEKNAAPVRQEAAQPKQGGEAVSVKIAQREAPARAESAPAAGSELGSVEEEKVLATRGQTTSEEDEAEQRRLDTQA